VHKLEIRFDPPIIPPVRQPTLIILGMGLGIVVAILFGAEIGVLGQISKQNWFFIACETAGEIFLRLIWMAVVPLVMASLIYGMASLGEIRRLGRLATRTLVYFTSTTAMALVVGLLLVNIVRPGDQVSQEDKEKLRKKYEPEAAKKTGIPDDEALAELAKASAALKAGDADPAEQTRRVESVRPRMPGDFGRMGDDVMERLLGAAAANDDATRQAFVKLACAKLDDIDKEAKRVRREKTSTVWTFLKSLVPKNPVQAMAEAQMLPLIFFALMFGLVATMVAPQHQRPVLDFSQAVTEVMVRMVNLIMWFAPIGVFGLIFTILGDLGLSVLKALALYCVVVLLGLALHLFAGYGSLLYFVGGLSPLRFFKIMRSVFATAFGTSSSAATLPVSMAAVRRMGVSEGVTSFVLPLGATINMDGTALYQAVAVVFIGQLTGHASTLGDQVTLLIMCTLASIGAAPVPGAGLITMIMVLDALGIPASGIAFIIGVDRFLDMCRTTVNVTGDAVGAAIIAKREGEPVLQT